MFEKNPEYYLWYVARTRARQKKIIFDIEPEDVIITENCPVFGNKLIKACGYSPDALSLDRINNSLGYVKGNVMVISRRANLLKSNMTLDEIGKIKNYMENNGKWT